MITFVILFSSFFCFVFIDSYLVDFYHYFFRFMHSSFYEAHVFCFVIFLFFYLFIYYFFFLSLKCFFNVMIPEYSSKEILERKLRIAIHETTSMDADELHSTVEEYDGRSVASSITSSLSVAPRHRSLLALAFDE